MFFFFFQPYNPLYTEASAESANKSTHVSEGGKRTKINSLKDLKKLTGLKRLKSFMRVTLASQSSRQPGSERVAQDVACEYALPAFGINAASFSFDLCSRYLNNNVGTMY